MWAAENGTCTSEKKHSSGRTRLKLFSSPKLKMNCKQYKRFFSKSLSFGTQ